jgi:hypothetical protein
VVLHIRHRCDCHYATSVFKSVLGHSSNPHLRLVVVFFVFTCPCIGPDRPLNPLIVFSAVGSLTI